MAYSNGTFRGLATGGVPLGIKSISPKKAKLPGNASNRKKSNELMKKLKDPNITKSEERKIRNQLANLVV